MERLKIGIGRGMFVLAIAMLASQAISLAAPRELLPTGDVLIDENPALIGARGFWTKESWAQIVDDPESQGSCLRIQIPDTVQGDTGQSVQSDVNGNAIELKAGKYEIDRSLDLARIKGWRVRITARVRTEGVSKPSVPWEGVRFGLVFNTGVLPYNANLNGPTDIPEWRDIVLNDIRIPEDAEAAKLFIGLVAKKGTLWVDRVRLTLVEPPLTKLAEMRKTQDKKAEWRGVNVGNGAINDDVIKRLSQNWNLNLMRWWVMVPPYSLPDSEFAAKREIELQKLDSALSQAESEGMKVQPVVSMQKDWMVKELGGTHLIFLDPAARKRFLETWAIIAQRYQGRNGIYGYDLLNEPVFRVPAGPGCSDWEGVVEETAAIINRIDPDAKIIVEPEEWWNTHAFLKLRPVAGKNVIYSVHMYRPFPLTHQGIKERKSMGVSYPSIIDGIKWDKETLREALKPARDFQLAYGVRMQVGEFSSIRWAPDDSSARWTKDCIDLFEEYGWDWTFHALIEWDGWNPDLGHDPSNRKPLAEPGAGKKVLLNAFSKNSK